LTEGQIRQAWPVMLSTRRRPPQPTMSAFSGFRFPAEVIMVAVRWYLRYNLPYRDVEELLLERCSGLWRERPNFRTCLEWRPRS
jgi:hypothetical protein